MFKTLFGMAQSDPEPTTTPVAASGLERLRMALSTTGKNLVERITQRGHSEETHLTQDDWEDIEETLIKADVGVDMAVEITGKIRARNLRTQSALTAFLRETFTAILNEGNGHARLTLAPGKLNIILVVGVNGAGKTTLIGKLAHRYRQAGHSVVIAAGDTFRAAAEDQLQVWADRAGAKLIRKDNGDPAAVIFDAIEIAKTEQADVLMIDTAGRLHNKFNLMEELSKIKKIIDRQAPLDVHRENLLVLDATTGQNAMRQAEVFHEAVDLTGVAVTKLDGSAKGGIVFNITHTYKLPIKLIGVGEKIEDLRDFDAAEFITALFGETA